MIAVFLAISSSRGWRAARCMRLGARVGVIAVLAANHLQRQFVVAQPNRAWVTDITYMRTREGWQFLAAVLDLFSRQVSGWSVGPRIDRELAINALLMAVWRRQPAETVMVHSEPGSQFSSYAWRDCCKVYNLQQSMGRRGNCLDNAVTENFFQLLKRERIKRRIYATRRRPGGCVRQYRDVR